jgi:hypothetical protein
MNLLIFSGGERIMKFPMKRIPRRSQSGTKKMEKTLYLDRIFPSLDPRFKYFCTYIKFIGGKWREDSWFFNDKADLIKMAKKARYIIQGLVNSEECGGIEKI